MYIYLQPWIFRLIISLVEIFKVRTTIQKLDTVYLDIVRSLLLQVEVLKFITLIGTIESNQCHSRSLCVKSHNNFPVMKSNVRCRAAFFLSCLFHNLFFNNSSKMFSFNFSTGFYFYCIQHPIIHLTFTSIHRLNRWWSQVEFHTATSTPQAKHFPSRLYHLLTQMSRSDHDRSIIMSAQKFVIKDRCSVFVLLLIPINLNFVFFGFFSQLHIFPNPQVLLSSTKLPSISE